MKPLLPALLLGLSAVATTPAVAYPVDCAILLCLSGGWPASIECAQARAVFIARITPWPVEPPLQIWNCPMRAVVRREVPIEQLFDIKFQSSASPLIYRPPALPLAPMPVTDQADVDISDPAYDFVRSIRVFQLEYSQHRGHDDNCSLQSVVRLGSYAVQGDFAWSHSSVDKMPQGSAFNAPQNGNDYFFRSVLVDWKDYAGTYGFEEVRY